MPRSLRALTPLTMHLEWLVRKSTEPTTTTEKESMPMNRVLTALPVYNEAKSVDSVLNEVLRYSDEVLVVDDGSTDGTAELLAKRSDIRLVTHAVNKGYGAALATAFEYAEEHRFEIVVTIDCDGQHEPKRIPRFVKACEGADIVSGSRYLKQYEGDSEPPAQRRWINGQITQEINRRLNLSLTDAFCGFKAYRVSALQKLDLTETGYSMPLELWVARRPCGIEDRGVARAADLSRRRPLIRGGTRRRYHSFAILPRYARPGDRRPGGQ